MVPHYRRGKQGFEWLMDEIMRAWEAPRRCMSTISEPTKPAKFKFLMGRYATRETKWTGCCALACSSTFTQFQASRARRRRRKLLEGFGNLLLFARKTPLAESRAAMRYIEHWLELGWRATCRGPLRGMEGYNQDDCRSTAALRRLARTKATELEQSGTVIARHRLAMALLRRFGRTPKNASRPLWNNSAWHLPQSRRALTEQEARWMLAQLLDWHRRENKASWWEGYRLAELDDDALLDERVALAGLRFVEKVACRANSRWSAMLTTNKKRKCALARTCITRASALAAWRQSIPSGEPSTSEGPGVDRHASGQRLLWDSPRGIKEHADALSRIADWVNAKPSTRPELSVRPRSLIA